MNQPNLLLLFAGAFLIFYFGRRFVGNTGGKQLAAKLAAGATVVDVRTNGEFAAGHYKGAINIPLDSLSSNLNKLGRKDKPVIVYCASGARSAAAVRVLKAQGFSDVSNAGSLGRIQSV